MPYGYISYAQARTELANRLDDYGKIYWSDAELGLYLKESLRTWQGLTGYWRGRMAFTLTSTPWFDLTQQPNSLISYNLKDTDLISIMCYHLIEPQLTGAGAWQGSDQFILADIVQALQRRRDQFLVETGMVTTQQKLNVLSPPSGRMLLPDNIIDVRRACWIAPAGPYGSGNYGAGSYGGSFLFSSLWNTDEWAARAFRANWSNTPKNPPDAHSVAGTPPLTLQFVPPPLASGIVELITVNSGAPLNPAVGVLLGIPDNFAHVVKWGALADLLGRSGQASDIFRAGYCQARWQEGIQIARLHTSIITAYINGVQTFPVSIRNLSTNRPGWQNVFGPPDTIGVMSWNLIASSPTPDTNAPYSLMLDVLQNAPVPVLDSDQIQVGREELDAILDGAQHIASFKQGGQEFSDSTALYQRMIELAKVKNARLRASVKFFGELSDKARKQEIDSPRRDAVEATA
jgi:hypothetical protein